MSDRISSLTVVLEPDVRDDDAEYIINAIRMIRRVIAVESHVAEASHYAAKRQAKYEIQDKFRAILEES